jgi:hypothetical protein
METEVAAAFDIVDDVAAFETEDTRIHPWMSMDSCI